MAAQTVGIKQAAQQLGLHPMYVRKLVSEGKLPAKKDENGKWQIAAETIKKASKARVERDVNRDKARKAKAEKKAAKASAEVPEDEEEDVEEEEIEEEEDEEEAS